MKLVIRKLDPGTVGVDGIAVDFYINGSRIGTVYPPVMYEFLDALKNVKVIDLVGDQSTHVEAL